MGILEILKSQSLMMIPPSASKHFDRGIRRYLCIGGRDSYMVTNAAGTLLTISPPLRTKYTARDLGGNLLSPQTSIFLVRAVQYGLRMTSNNIPVLYRDQYPGTASSQRDTIAENIEDLQFQYVLAAGGPPQDAPIADPRQIQMIRVTVRARTAVPDPEFAKAGTRGLRERTITSNIQIRNR